MQSLSGLQEWWREQHSPKGSAKDDTGLIVGVVIGAVVLIIVIVVIVGKFFLSYLDSTASNQDRL